MTLSELELHIQSKEQEYRVLWDLNLEPENQHSWDDMLRLEGYISGLHLAQSLLEKENI